MQVFVSDLVESGYFSHLSSSEQTLAVDQCLSYRTLLCESTSRFVYVDPENLAEQGVTAIENIINGFVHSLAGISFDFEDKVSQGYKWDIYVDSTWLFSMWDRLRDETELGWGLAFRRFCGMLQWLLDRVRPESEKLYISHFGNDGLIVVVPRNCESIILDFGLRKAFGEDLYSPPICPPENGG